MKFILHLPMLLVYGSLCCIAGKHPMKGISEKKQEDFEKSAI